MTFPQAEPRCMRLLSTSPPKLSTLAHGERCGGAEEPRRAAFGKRAPRQSAGGLLDELAQPAFDRSARSASFVQRHHGLDVVVGGVATAEGLAEHVAIADADARQRLVGERRLFSGAN